jgi:hypothetical protein
MNPEKSTNVSLRHRWCHHRELAWLNIPLFAFGLSNLRVPVHQPETILLNRALASLLLTIIERYSMLCAGHCMYELH